MAGLNNFEAVLAAIFFYMCIWLFREVLERKGGDQ
jgi:hypothetical protein